MSNITGRLLNAQRIQVGGTTRIYGAVYEDTRGRFLDGDMITTSPVLSEEGNIIITKFSIYEVEEWAT